MAISKSTQMAQEILSKAEEFGFKLDVVGSTVKVAKRIPKNDSNAFASAEAESSILLGMLPQTSSGSTWGTDGASVGGYVAIQNGAFMMNKSGCSARLVSAIKKIIY